MATITEQVVHEPRILLRNVSWKTYEALLEELEEGGSHVQLTFDDGDLELMSPSGLHERYKKLISRLIETLALELNIRTISFGSTTYRREDLAKGLEPDECYYIQHAAEFCGRTEFDLTVDPPPDLVIEIDLTRSRLEKRAIYAQMRVPELWFYNGESLRVLRLEGTQYRPANDSDCLPFLPVQELTRFIRQAEAGDELAMMREFLAWLRNEIAPKLQP